jgi:hypothetical protein
MMLTFSCAANLFFQLILGGCPGQVGAQDGRKLKVSI